jgi:hypothetical protein
VCCTRRQDVVPITSIAAQPSTPYDQLDRKSLDDDRRLAIPGKRGGYRRRARASAVDAAMAPTATHRRLRQDDWTDDGDQRIGQSRECARLGIFANAVDVANASDYLNSEYSCS